MESFEHIDWFVVLIAVWLASVGGVIGSFLNVVIYRLPLGMSLVRPASRCPVCLTPIRWYDNLPVIGWVLLGGRCRDCGTAISARYPRVEASVALFFVLLAASEFCCGGARDAAYAASTCFHLPWASDLSDTGVWLRYWSQVLLGVTLLGAGLIEYDGQLVPLRVFRPALLVSVAAPFVAREVRPLRFDEGWPRPLFTSPDTWQQPLDLMLGAWTALIAALIAWPLLGPDRRGARPASMGLLAVGATLGWQLTAAIGLIWIAYLIGCAALRPRAEKRGGLLPLMVVAGVVLLGWRPLWAACLQAARP